MDVLPRHIRAMHTRREVKKKLWQCNVKLFSSNTGTLWTDGQTDGRTDRIPISISRVSMLTRDKNSKFEVRTFAGWQKLRLWDLARVQAKQRCGRNFVFKKNAHLLMILLKIIHFTTVYKEIAESQCIALNGCASNSLLYLVRYSIRDSFNDRCKILRVPVHYLHQTTTGQTGLRS